MVLAKPFSPIPRLGLEILAARLHGANTGPRDPL
jgi:hypothetical protein